MAKETPRILRPELFGDRDADFNFLRATALKRSEDGHLVVRLTDGAEHTIHSVAWDKLTRFVLRGIDNGELRPDEATAD